MYKRIIRPILFLLEPEWVHHFSFTAIRLMHCIPFVGLFIRVQYQVKNPKLVREVFGIKFPNPVGLAAGFDKDAKLFKELSNFGFGFIEIGTVTPKPQGGNPKPRLFRLKKDKGIINRMGFNNEGVAAAFKRLKRNKNIIIGGNIGKNKTTPNENAQEDYLICFEALFDVVDYFVVNVSSPNTPNLRDLQEKAPLTALLNVLQERNASKPKRKPILLKIAPDLTDTQLSDIIDIVATTQIDGVIATNTTLSRKGLQSEATLTQQAGGLSGKPLTNRSTEVIRFLHQQSKGAFPIIGVGGIHTPKDAQEKLNAGASLIQLYTGFVYEGPKVVSKINNVLL
ncbi:MAG: quinone-dependent dihydroorotate dehydrogenase [Flavobacteriaceae bacterium]|nr:quinone-dependent dihydroorotate dehydrogenase [Flavobacteriaceae bacterium]MDG2314911.1 quinone-dependent dihydroorotate dehydrogenase [Flavobacteriaceae bacterium]